MSALFGIRFQVITKHQKNGKNIFWRHDTDVNCYVVSYAKTETLDGIKKKALFSS